MPDTAQDSYLNSPPPQRCELEDLSHFTEKWEPERLRQSNSFLEPAWGRGFLCGMAAGGGCFLRICGSPRLGRVVTKNSILSPENEMPGIKNEGNNSKLIT